jgi:hypothetical protein
MNRDAWQSSGPRTCHLRPRHSEIIGPIDVVVVKAAECGVDPIGTLRIVDDQLCNESLRRCSIVDPYPAWRESLSALLYVWGIVARSVLRQVYLSIVMTNDNERGI